MLSYCLDQLYPNPMLVDFTEGLLMFSLPVRLLLGASPKVEAFSLFSYLISLITLPIFSLSVSCLDPMPPLGDCTCFLDGPLRGLLLPPPCEEESLLYELVSRCLRGMYPVDFEEFIFKNLNYPKVD
jgi:hypothetical protein